MFIIELFPCFCIFEVFDNKLFRGRGKSPAMILTNLDFPWNFHKVASGKTCVSMFESLSLIAIKKKKKFKKVLFSLNEI